MCLVPGKTRKFLFKFVAKTEDVGKKIEVSYEICLKQTSSDKTVCVCQKKFQIIHKFIKWKMNIFRLDFPRDIIHGLVGFLLLGLYYT